MQDYSSATMSHRSKVDISQNIYILKIKVSPY